MAKPLGFFEMLDREIQKELKLFHKKQTRLKIKIFLLFVLPVVILLLAAKVFQTFVELKLKSFTTPQVPKARPVVKPVEKEVRKPEFVTPVSVPVQIIPPVEKKPQITITEEEFGN